MSQSPDLLSSARLQMRPQIRRGLRQPPNPTASRILFPMSSGFLQRPRPASRAARWERPLLIRKPCRGLLFSLTCFGRVAATTTNTRRRNSRPNSISDDLIGLQKQKGRSSGSCSGLRSLIWRRPTFPHSYPCSIIGPARLNFRVRDGNGCDPRGMTARNLCIEIRCGLTSPQKI